MGAVHPRHGRTCCASHVNKARHFVRHIHCRTPTRASPPCHQSPVRPLPRERRPMPRDRLLEGRDLQPNRLPQPAQPTREKVPWEKLLSGAHLPSGPTNPLRMTAPPPPEPHHRRFSLLPLQIRLVREQRPSAASATSSRGMALESSSAAFSSSAPAPAAGTWVVPASGGALAGNAAHLRPSQRRLQAGLSPKT